MNSSQRKQNIAAALIFLTCAKILCIPSYRSTDFDVHRNWLAITRHLPIQEWYFDNHHGTTVHTLDYPPTFAFFEYLLSNNPVTNWLLSSQFLDERCLALLPDSDNEPSPKCVFFHRLTVILSDLLLWLGAAIACDELGFLLVVLNPGLIWLDHVHFQYNGAMLGILLASLGLLVRGRDQEDMSYHLHHLGASFLYALLLTLKHLYLPLAPVYFIYILSNYCFRGSQFSLPNFLGVAAVTGTTLTLPFVPFLVQKDPYLQLTQIASRLFPFGRGLVHDYWAGNVWAIYMFLNKIVAKMFGEPLPEISPPFSSLCLFLSLLPGLIYAWKCTPKMFLNCVVFCSMSAFMTAYHVHEKAIMTSIIPLAMLIQHDPERRLFLRMNAIGLVSLFPLLFRPVELTLKLVTTIGFMAFVTSTFDDFQYSTLDIVGCGILVFLVLFLEVLHPLFIFPNMEFLPLMLMSVGCACGLMYCWGYSGYLLFQNQGRNNNKMSSSVEG